MRIFSNGPLERAGKKARKQTATFLLGVFSFAIMSTLVLAPQPSKAQYTDPITSVQTTTTNVWNTIKDAFVEAAVTAVVNGVNYFATQMAYTLAVALTSDCPGQIVCWNSKAFEDGFKQAWQGAIGEAVGTLSEQGGFSALGFDLCNPGVNFSLKIQLGLLDELKPPPPKCDFGALTSNWENFSNSVSSGEVLKGLKPTFSKGESPLSVSLGVMDGLIDVKEEAKREDIMKRIMDASAGGGFSDIRDPVSGRVKSPASVTHQEFESMKKQQTERPEEFSASAAAGQIASKAVISIVINVVQTFAMTLVSRLLNKLVNGLLSTEELIAFQPDLILNPEGILQSPGQSGLEQQFAETRFSAAQPRDAGLIDPILQFSVCPGANRGPNNCVLDQQLAGAIRVADVTPISVGEAIEKGMLHGDWPLIPSAAQVKDQDPFCYTFGYCESNLRKLRGARIIPIGWEIAASKANVNGSTKLKEVVDAFHECNGDGAADSAHPWCHLIDPAWILKAPPTQCRAMAYGAVLLSPDIPSRVEQCVDAQTCLEQDDNGTCVGGWGYCARERSVWRFNGDSCPAAYNTCRTLRARTGEVRNFVLNTIDHGICNSDNAGCRQYGLNLSTVSCSLGSDCSDPAGCQCAKVLSGKCVGGSVAGQACNISSQCSGGGTCATCVIQADKTSCTSTDGVACRIPYPCSNPSGCTCGNSLSCTVPNGQRSCSSVTGGTGTGDDWQLDPSRFFNKSAQSCDAMNNGCSAMIRLQPGDSLNLIKNGSFEELEDGDNDSSPDHARFWTPAAEVPNNSPSSLVRDGSRSVDGTNALRLATTMNADICTSSSACPLDLGCPCVMSAGPLSGYSCKVVKGQTSCPVTNLALQDGITVRRGTTYTISFSLIPDSGNTVSGVANLQFRNVNNLPAPLTPTNVVSATDITGGTGTADCAANGGGISFVVSGTKDADQTALRASCTFVIDGVDVSTMYLWLGAMSSGNFMDAVQFEEGGGTPYHNGYGSTDPALLHVKVPPSYLGCTGSDGDRPECTSFAGVCREEEVGCDAYHPSNGDPMIPGVVGPQDLCPKECSGYDVFKQEASDFDKSKFPVYFIPDSAQACSENEVGCSEFTNVESEKIEYYSRLRLCLKPDDPSVSTFYSWEGSDTTGYQLRVWSFKHTTNGAGAKSSVENGSTTDIADGVASDVCASASCANAGAAPCTKLDTGAVNCASESIAFPAGSTVGLCNRDAVDAGDLDCREFYDVDGNRHYRQLSKTIIASSTCSQYRITVSTQDDCEDSNGRWDSGKGQCIYLADSSQSNQCTSQQNGCRAYKGNAASNVRSLVTDGFENGIDGWLDATNNQSEFAISSESVTVGGHSLRLLANGGEDERAMREVGGFVAPQRSYTLSFWARGSGTLETYFENSAFNATCTLDQACAFSAPDTCACFTATGLTCQVASGATSCTINNASAQPPVSANPPATLYFSDESAATPAPRITLTSEWKRYELGPVAVAAPTGTNRAWGTYPVKLVFNPRGVCVGGTAAGSMCGTPGSSTCAGGGTCQTPSEVFIDSVDLKEVQDSIYVLRDTWKIPASCDSTTSGIPSPQEMLGCKEYRNNAAEEVYLRSFSRLCREKAVGCGAFSYTQNTTENPYPEAYNAVCGLTEADNVTPRRCGYNRCTYQSGTPNLCNSASGCTCNLSGSTCTVLNGAKTCDIPVPADSGASCVCNYNTKNPAYLTSTAPAFLSDVCRVAIGDTECRFKLDAWDLSSRIDEHPDRINVTSDQRVHLVVNRSSLCSSDQAGCRVLGKPKFTYEADCSLPLSGSSITNGVCTSSSGCTCGPINGSTCQVKNGEKTCKVAFEHGVVDKWDAIALKDDPKRYEQALCSGVSLGCEEYTAADGTYYFKNPDDKVCEYKTNVNYQGQQVSGYFRKSTSGTLFPCYPELLKNGDYFAMYKNADAKCTLPNITTATITNGKCATDDGCQCAIAPNPTPVCRVFKGNTTCGYQGWVGQCEAKYDRCEEFIDPAHTSAANPDGEPYYYIVNAKLDLKTCSGKASLKEGCVLFKQTSKTQNIYSASATYYRSLSEANSGSVAPVNCDNDPRNPACNQRCVSIPKGACTETPEKTCTQDTDDPRWGCPGATNFCQGKKQYGSGCNADDPQNRNKDCNVSIGEVCAGVKSCSGSALTFCDSNTDCPGGQTCNSTSATILIPKAEGAVTRNDSNLIIRVRPDRECAQWLACKSFETVFDSQAGKFKPRCTAFTLCEGTGTSAGANQLECAAAVEPEKKVLTEVDYAKRDITWSGLEYSGYSIPARYPAQFLSPVGIITGACFTAAGTPHSPLKTCSSTTECTSLASDSYCKDLDGICKGENEGRACDDDYGLTQCGANGYCSKSYFDTHRFGVLLDSAYTCATDADCDGNDSGGKSCSSNTACRPGGIGPASCSGSKCKVNGIESMTGVVDDGRCVQHRCYYSYGGGPFQLLDSTNRAQCRAYPESDAPYGNSVVDTEQEIGDRGYDRKSYQAISRKSGFGGANVCTNRNDCECSYKRLEFGRGSSAVRFIGVSNGKLPTSWSPTPTNLGTNANSATPDQTWGVCSGGTRDGWTCRDAADCKVSPDDSGSCTKLAKISTVLGWPGFCMDLDKSLNVNGSQDQFSCNLWLPVDQLAGAPDVFNQYREAGYKPDMEQLLYCAVALGNRKGSNYYFGVNEPGGAAFVSACQPDTTCTSKASENACTGGSGPVNNVGGGWSALQLGVDGKACYWDGSCKNRVHMNGIAGGTFQDTGGDEPFPGFNGSTDFGGYVPNACDKASAKASSIQCTGAAIGTFLLTGGFGSAMIAAGGCHALLAGWCNEAGFLTCNGNVGGSGRLFHTSWQDATGNFVNLGSNNWYEGQIVAAVVEMTEGSTSGNVTSKMFLSPKNDWVSSFRWGDNCDAGLCNVNPKGYAEASSGNNDVCINLMNRYRNGQDYEGTCENIEDAGGQDNCVGARFEWDGSRKLLGLTTMLCHNASTVWHKVPARARIFFREACTEIIQAHNAGNDETPNFAWTDRLWDAKNGGGPGVVGLPGSFQYERTVGRPGVNPAQVEPFGPITPPMSETTYNGVVTLPVRWPIPLYKTEGGSAFTALRIGPAVTGNHTPPCSENETGNPSDAGAVYTTYCDNGYTMVAGDPGLPEPSSYPDQSGQRFTAAGQAYACEGACDAPDASGLGSNAENTAKDRLAKIFVQTWKQFSWNESDQRLTAPVYSKSKDFAYDMRAINVTVNSAPKIVPPNTGDCDPGSEGLCEESSQSGIQVSGVTNSPYKTGDGSQTATGGRAQVYLKYYAWADSNHMPLRRKMVDWGDKTFVDTWGWFKNHRGCEADAEPCKVADQVCGSDNGDWGKTLQACEPRYFQDVHTYTCTHQLLASLPACAPSEADSKTYPCSDGSACVFKPRVQFLDNWGQCNGTCPGGVSGDSCFNNANDLDLTTPSVTPDSQQGRNECLKLESGPTDSYNRTAGTDLLKPYTEGPVIKVRP